jgi:hypothetical protein
MHAIILIYATDLQIRPLLTNYFEGGIMRNYHCHCNRPSKNGAKVNEVDVRDMQI